ncbi:MAG: glycerate kinase [Bacteroidales bacterium]|nr:glycerate kinase [Bacteroidales bacterium]
MTALLLIDSWKGCLSSEEAEDAARQAFGPEDTVTAVPVSDGGEGFCRILTDLHGGSFRTVPCCDPLGRPILARYGIAGDRAILDTASASGLTLLAPHERNPLLASSFGTGQLLRAALQEPVREVLVGLGGSATVDGGKGLLEAVGTIPAGIRLHGFYDTDVPFCGPGGAVEVFAPQKGATPDMMEELERRMAERKGFMEKHYGVDVTHMSGAGAAGGIGGALLALGAQLHRGISSCLDLANLPEAPDWVITGEGCADAQTLTGKVPAGVLERYRGRSRVILLAGKVRNRAALEAAGFEAVLQVTPDNLPENEALDPERTKRNIASVLRNYLLEKQ